MVGSGRYTDGGRGKREELRTGLYIQQLLRDKYSTFGVE